MWHGQVAGVKKMSIANLVEFFQSVFSQFNFVILIGAVIIATGVLWDMYPDGIGWAVLTGIVFLVVGIVGAYVVDGVVLPTFVLEGFGGRGAAMGYGIGIAIVLVVSAKTIVGSFRHRSERKP
jgi:hypothetical protein